MCGLANFKNITLVLEAHYVQKSTVTIFLKARLWNYAYKRKLLFFSYYSSVVIDWVKKREIKINFLRVKGRREK